VTTRTTTDRGYGADHQAERAKWQRRMDQGEAVDCHAERCLEPSRWIRPGQPWDLGHTPDRTAWTGPEHPLCNRAEGGRRGAAATNGQRAALRHSRSW
jgi:hypothetical protein